MTAESIANEVAIAQGWTDATVASLALSYIDRQGSNDAFADYLRGIAEEENGTGPTKCLNCGGPTEVEDGVTYCADDCTEPEGDEEDEEDEEFGPYDWTCTYCGSALNEDNFDRTGSRKCYDDDHSEHLDEGAIAEFEDEAHG